MKITVKLDSTSIESAISKLQDALDQLMADAGEWLDIMLVDGEEVANIAYGSMATAWGRRDSDGEADGIISGHIGVTGENDDVVYIAEFGAGDTTMESTGFENDPPVPVYAGAYSELVGSGEYAEKGYWRFGGQKFTEVPARHGLLNAKAHILAAGDDIAREVILHD